MVVFTSDLQNATMEYDVFISKNITIWKSVNGKYYAYVIIGNKGKNIKKEVDCDVLLLKQSYFNCS